MLDGKSKIGMPQGAPTLFTREQEELLVKHVEDLAAVGYPVGRGAFTRLAADSAVLLGKKEDNGHLMTSSWMEAFLKRWPNFKVSKPQKLDIRRARATSGEVVTKYFDELEEIIRKNDLTDKPHLVYIVDENGFQVDHTPSNCIGSNDVTTEKGVTTTVLATGNAAGSAMPPFFVYKGKQMVDNLMTGAFPGTQIAMSDSGWSNGRIFKTYLEDHFLKFLPNRNPGQHALLLYDGHAPLISIPLIELAQSHQIILFVLPAHTTRVLQPLDEGIFGSMKCFYNAEFDRHMTQNPGEIITRLSLTKIISESYAKAMTPSNLMSAFRGMGIFPPNREVINPHHFAIADRPNLKKSKSDSAETDKIQASIETTGLANFLNLVISGRLHVSPGTLSPSCTAFLMCDMQEMVKPVIEHFDDILEVCVRLVKTSKILEIPLIATEQNPEGLGKTVEELDVSHAKGVFAKTKFSMVIPEVEEQLNKLPNLTAVVLFGVETHVCLEQTAIDLVKRGLDVHVVADATSSRSMTDRMFAFEHLRQSGVMVTTSEAVILHLLGDTENPKFKEVQALVKDLAPTSGLNSRSCEMQNNHRV